MPKMNLPPVEIAMVALEATPLYGRLLSDRLRLVVPSLTAFEGGTLNFTLRGRGPIREASLQVYENRAILRNTAALLLSEAPAGLSAYTWLWYELREVLPEHLFLALDEEFRRRRKIEYKEWKGKKHGG